MDASIIHYYDRVRSRKSIHFWQETTKESLERPSRERVLFDGDIKDAIKREGRKDRKSIEYLREITRYKDLHMDANRRHQVTRAHLLPRTKTARR